MCTTLFPVEALICQGDQCTVHAKSLLPLLAFGIRAQHMSRMLPNSLAISAVILAWIIDWFHCSVNCEGSSSVAYRHRFPIDEQHTDDEFVLTRQHKVVSCDWAWQVLGGAPHDGPNRKVGRGSRARDGNTNGGPLNKYWHPRIRKNRKSRQINSHQNTAWHHDDFGAGQGAREHT